MSRTSDFSVYSGVAFDPPTTYSQSNTNEISVYNGGTGHKVTLGTTQLLYSDYRLNFPNVPPTNSQLLLYETADGGGFQWQTAGSGSFSNTIQNVVIVQKNPSPDQFSTIVAGLASITNASATNPYVVLVGPGVYVENNPIQLKTNVAVQGYSQREVTVKPQNASEPLFVGAPDSVLQTLTISGAPLAGVMYDGAPGIQAFIVNECSFSVSTTMVSATSSNGFNRMYVNNIQISSITVPSTGFSITSIGSNHVVVYVNNLVSNPQTSNGVSEFVVISGPDAAIVMNNVLVASALVSPTGVGVNFSDGATVGIQDCTF